MKIIEVSCLKWQIAIVNKVIFFKVIKVERLENPLLWRKYSQRRELLLNELAESHEGTEPAAFTAIENLEESRGPMLTTENIDPNGPLGREIYHQVCSL
jgi:hypothetical protein